MKTKLIILFVLWCNLLNSQYSNEFLSETAKIEEKDNGIPLSYNLSNESLVEAIKVKTKNQDVWILSSSFTIPMARFDFIENQDKSKGSVSLFNSIGAGIGIYHGEIEETIDVNENNKSITTNFYNKIGLQAGFLFSTKGTDDDSNVFALTLSLSVLDFQVGYGYELGDIREDQKRGFLTLAYSIPLSKLTKKGTLVLFSRGKQNDPSLRSQEGDKNHLKKRGSKFIKISN